MKHSAYKKSYKEKRALSTLCTQHIIFILEAGYTIKIESGVHPVVAKSSITRVIFFGA